MFKEIQIQHNLQYLLERLFYYASIRYYTGTIHIHACACTYMLYVNYVIAEHNKPQIFTANKKSSQEFKPADHAQEKTPPEKNWSIQCL